MKTLSLTAPKCGGGWGGGGRGGYPGFVSRSSRFSRHPRLRQAPKWGKGPRPLVGRAPSPGGPGPKPPGDLAPRPLGPGSRHSHRLTSCKPKFLTSCSSSLQHFSRCGRKPLGTWPTSPWALHPGSLAMSRIPKMPGLLHRLLPAHSMQPSLTFLLRRNNKVQGARS